MIGDAPAPARALLARLTPITKSRALRRVLWLSLLASLAIWIVRNAPLAEIWAVLQALQPWQIATLLLLNSASTGQRRQMRRVGTLSFTLKGQPLSLGAFGGDLDALGRLNL